MLMVLVGAREVMLVIYMLNAKNTVIIVFSVDLPDINWVSMLLSFSVLFMHGLRQQT